MRRRNSRATKDYENDPDFQLGILSKDTAVCVSSSFNQKVISCADIRRHSRLSIVDKCSYFLSLVVAAKIHNSSLAG